MKTTTKQNIEQGHQPLGVALQAPGAGYQNKLKLNKIARPSTP
jgi:hypothetical protein